MPKETLRYEAKGQIFDTFAEALAYEREQDAGDALARYTPSQNVCYGEVAEWIISNRKALLQLLLWLDNGKPHEPMPKLEGLS